MSEIYSQTITVATIGSAGNAAGSQQITGIHGFLLDVYLNYSVSCPDSANVYLNDYLFGSIFINSGSHTDVWLAPRKQTTGPDCAVTGTFEMIPINATITIQVDQADALTACLVATIRWVTP